MSKRKLTPLAAPAPVVLDDAERAAIESKRKHEANVKACAAEIEEVLRRHGLQLNVIANPQITLAPRG